MFPEIYHCKARHLKLVAVLSLWMGIGPAAFAILTATNLWPANGATNVCTDTPLRITFNAPPTLLRANQIRIYTAADNLVDTIDFSLNDANNVQSRTIAGTSYKTYPVLISGNTATIYPHLGVLTSNTTYYVLINSGIFTNAGEGVFSGVSNKVIWTFTTKPVSPAAGTANFVIAADGSGDFCTVQGAIDFLPNNNSQPRLFNIRNGVYQEINRINSKHKLKFRGQNRKQTIIAYPNNANLNSTRYQLFVGADDIVFENLTLTNSTPKGGSQAESLCVNGARCILNNIDLCSYQDTFLCNGSGNQTYVYKSLIQGDTDFIWGAGTAMFVNCEIRALNAGHNCQMRTLPSYYGAVFVECQLTKPNGATFTTHNLGRLVSSSSSDPGTNGNVAYINCRMDTHISAAGWLNPASWPTDRLRWWEYQSMNLAGTDLVNTNSRAAFSKQLSTAEAVPLRNPAIVFGLITNGTAAGGGWMPQLSPNIISHPANNNVNAGQAAVFTVSATGIPEPLFQWRKNGSIIPGMTNTSLTISNTLPGDIAAYSCLISNSAGSVVSDNAILTVNPLPQPQLNSALVAGNLFTLSVSGNAGLVYTILTSTNLIQWSPAFTTNNLAADFLWSEPVIGTSPARYYRILASPP